VLVPIYYLAPLSTMFQVVQEQDAATLYFPLIFINLIITITWLVHGYVALDDILVWGPNALCHITIL
jgi:hypothetical protein